MWIYREIKKIKILKNSTCERIIPTYITTWLHLHNTITSLHSQNIHKEGQFTKAVRKDCTCINCHGNIHSATIFPTSFEYLFVSQFVCRDSFTKRTPHNLMHIHVWCSIIKQGRPLFHSFMPPSFECNTPNKRLFNISEDMIKYVILFFLGGGYHVIN